MAATDDHDNNDDDDDDDDDDAPSASASAAAGPPPEPSRRSDLSCPRRDLAGLHCPGITYLCAIGALPPDSCADPRSDPRSDGGARKRVRTGSRGSAGAAPPPSCVPCAYKIGAFDVALDSEFVRRIPNRRPEECPRSASGRSGDGGASAPAKGTATGYRPDMRVLCVGDGDFTFSLAVARIVFGDGEGDGEGESGGGGSDEGGTCGGTVVATSYEDEGTLRKVYPDFDDTLASLNSYRERVIVGYNVDATRLDETLPRKLRVGKGRKKKEEKKREERTKFHRVCWNFPCTAIGYGQDGQNDAMERNKELVRRFVVSAALYLHERCGEIHIAHKTKPPYNQWGMEVVALEGMRCLVGDDDDDGGPRSKRRLEYKGRVVLDRCALPPYVPRKALDRKSFPCHDACVYVFGWEDDCARDVPSRQPPTIPLHRPDLSEGAPPDPSSIVPVTERLIEEVRSTHLRAAEGRSKERKEKKRGHDERIGPRKKRRKKKKR
ncbi:hypothetical protein ACHAWF_006014 [Thalassiosira exigua]